MEIFLKLTQVSYADSFNVQAWVSFYQKIEEHYNWAKRLTSIHAYYHAVASRDRFVHNLHLRKYWI